MTIAIPQGMTGAMVYTDAGFNGFGERVTFKRLRPGDAAAGGGIPVEVRVAVPVGGRGAIPVRVTVAVDGGAPAATVGTSDGVTVAFRLPTR